MATHQFTYPKVSPVAPTPTAHGAVPAPRPGVSAPGR